MDSSMDRVVPLDELDDFEIAEGDPDVRGWEVQASDGSKIGEVDNLLVDTGAMKVRYLDVDIDSSLLTDSNDDRHVLVPIGYARLDEGNDQVRVDNLASSDIMGLPVYTHAPITREFETEVRQSYDNKFNAEKTDSDYYAHEHFDDKKFYGAGRDEKDARVTLSEEELAIGRRQRAAGEVEIDKDVETRHVKERVPRRHEEVTIDRHPAPAGMSANPKIEEDEVHIPVTEEELVVEKRAVPKEELVVKKRSVTDEETVEADLRRERADVRREGDVNLRDERNR
ncbi:MAG TPA: DUF2382 domain-containing protein [Longimicrobiaceae bacterium]|nr:DUF2382 domain-containing protein [Longimicrobiaceae bacterium]